MSNDAALKNAVSTYLKRMDASPSESLAALETCVAVPGWEERLGNARTARRMMLVSLERCSKDEFNFLQYLKTIHKAAINFSPRLRNQLLSHISSAFMKLEITASLLLEFVDLAMGLWNEREWLWSSQEDINKVLPAFEDLLCSSDSADVKSALMLLEKLMKRTPQMSWLWERFFAEMVMEGQLIAVLVEKCKNLHDLTADESEINLLVDVWALAFKGMGSTTRTLKVANRFFQVLEAPRVAKKLSPTIGCRILRKYMKLVPPDVMNSTKQLRMLTNFAKTVKPRDANEEREYRMLRLAIWDAIPSEENELREVARISAEDWTSFVVGLPLKKALKAWNITCGISVTESESRDRHPEQEFIVDEDEGDSLILKLIKLVVEVNPKVDYANKLQADLFVRILCAMYDAYLSDSEARRLCSGKERMLCTINGALKSLVRAAVVTSSGENMLKLIQYLVRLRPADVKSPEMEEWDAAVAVAAIALSETNVSPAASRELDEFYRIIAEDGRHTKKFASLTPATRHIRNGDLLSAQKPTSSSREDTRSIRNESRPFQLVDSPLTPRNQRKLTFGDVDARKAIPMDLHEEGVGFTAPSGFRSPSSGKKNETKILPLNAIDSQEFVVIDTPMKKPKLLTEHQKEVLSQKRPDIPALYADLSQQSQLPFGQESSDSLQLPAKTESKPETNLVSLSRPVEVDMEEAARLSPPAPFVPVVDITTPDDDDDDVVEIEPPPLHDVETVNPTPGPKAGTAAVESETVSRDVGETSSAASSGSGRHRKQTQPRRRETPERRKRPAISPVATKKCSTPKRGKKVSEPVNTSDVWLDVEMLAKRDEKAPKPAKSQPAYPTKAVAADEVSTGEDDDVIFDSQEKSPRRNGRPLRRRASDPILEGGRNGSEVGHGAGCGKENRDGVSETGGKGRESDVAGTESPLRNANPAPAPQGLLRSDSSARMQSRAAAENGLDGAVTPPRAPRSSILKDPRKSGSESKFRVRFNPTVDEVAIQDDFSQEGAVGGDVPSKPEGEMSDDEMIDVPPAPIFSSADVERIAAVVPDPCDGAAAVGETQDDDDDGISTGGPSGVSMHVYEDTPLEDAVRGDDELVRPDLVDRAEPVVDLVRYLTPPTWVETFVDKLEAMNVTTVGQFCALKQLQLANLPIRARDGCRLSSVREQVDRWHKDILAKTGDEEADGRRPVTETEMAAVSVDEDGGSGCTETELMNSAEEPDAIDVPPPPALTAGRVEEEPAAVVVGDGGVGGGAGTEVTDAIDVPPPPSLTVGDAGAERRGGAQKESAVGCVGGDGGSRDVCDDGGRGTSGFFRAVAAVSDLNRDDLREKAAEVAEEVFKGLGRSGSVSVVRFLADVQSKLTDLLFDE